MLRYITLGPTSAISWPFLSYGIWNWSRVPTCFLFILSLFPSSLYSSFTTSLPHYHRSCYRPFPVFHREFTGGRSVPRERREVHRVREEQGPNLLSRDLPRTSQTPPELLRNVMFCDGQFGLLPAEQPLLSCLFLVFNYTLRLSADGREDAQKRYNYTHIWIPA